MEESRSHRSFVNSGVALTYFLITLIVQFYSRKIFLEYLGADLLGLNTTVMNLLQFLNLAELGISTAVGFTLYAPLAKDDKISINEIMTLQGKLYRKIGSLIIGGAVVLMCFFPIIFKDIKLPFWYTYASFGVFLFSALIGYFINYKQILLSASQQDYKVQYSYRTFQLLKIVAQTCAVKFLEYPYIWWLFLEVIFAIISSISLSRMTHKTFPWLRSVNDSFIGLKNKYPEFTKKIKQLFYHKIGTFVLTQSSPIIIYAFASLSTVAYYGNYMLIIIGVQQLVAAIFNSLTAGVGNLVVESGKNKIWDVFNELYSLRFVICSSLCFTIYYSASYFITAWIGKQYLLPNSTVFLMVLILFINLTRYSVETFINAYGLYQDVYAPAIEAVLNLGLSVLLGYYWDLNGILLGVSISLFAIAIIWKPYFLFTRGLKGYLKRYILIYIKHLLFLIISWIFSVFILDRLNISIDNNWLNFFAIGILSLLVFTILLVAMTYISHCGIVYFIYRIKNILK